MPRKLVAPGSLAQTPKGKEVAEAIKGKPVKIERTSGRVSHSTLLGSNLRVYKKPSLGEKDIIRRAGVTRTSDVVREINKIVAKEKPAQYCKKEVTKKAGLAEFRKCMSAKMKEILAKYGFARAETTLATATASE